MLLKRAGFYLENLLKALLIVIVVCVLSMLEGMLMCAKVRMCVKVHTWRSKDDLQESAPHFSGFW